MLLPDKPQIIRLLHRYHTWERRLIAAPSNAVVRRRFEDTAYTLCILMGHRTAREAVLAAERYVRTGSPRAPHGSDARDQHEIRPAARRMRQE